MDINSVNTSVPVLALRGLVIFPGMTLHFDVGRSASIAALKYALSNNEKIFLVTQKDIKEEEPLFDDLYKTGVMAVVKQVLRVSEKSNSVRVIVEGKYRATLNEIVSSKPFLRGIITRKDDKPLKDLDFDYETALIRNAQNLFGEYCDVSGKISTEVVSSVFAEETSGGLADSIASSIFLSIENKQLLLDEHDTLKRLHMLCVFMAQEIDILILEDDIQSQVQDSMDKNQHEYYLREQLKAIYDELGEGDDVPEESKKYRELIMESKMPDDAKEMLIREAARLGKLSTGSPDANVIRTYLDKCLALPWGVYTKDNTNLTKAAKQLDKDHYGLKTVKERIIETLAARILSPDMKGNIICLAGPPGVGKTSVARSVAQAMNKNYVRISLGGVRDEAEIRGHRRTYIGAIPGRVINAMIEAKSSNPLILFDEIDKLNGDFRGDPAAALLEVLDAEQNFSFCDHYIELPFDLSKVLFITTANDKFAIPEPLRDRMEVIDLGSYTHEEKFNIAKKHLIPKQYKEHNITRKQLKITDKAIHLIIDGYTREAGVRQLERLIAKIMRKTAVALLNDAETVVTVTDKNLSEYLGAVKFRNDETENDDEIGVVNGLAWTSVGGEMLQVEASVLPGTGKLELTGSLGDVMKESAKIAISLVRSRADKFGIDKDFYKDKDIHIHVPEGAVPKDGPSAGVTLTTALFSALSDIEVNSSVAMTGEITLRGRVLPIGGLKEKSMAAYRHGKKTVIIPWENSPDIDEIDDTVKANVNFVPVKTIDEVLAVAMKKSGNPGMNALS